MHFLCDVRNCILVDRIFITIGRIGHCVTPEGWADALGRCLPLRDDGAGQSCKSPSSSLCRRLSIT
jgi:hypothetical protein